MNLLLSCLSPRSCLIECAWLWEDEPQRPRYFGELLQVWWVMQLLVTEYLSFSLNIPWEKEIFIALPEGFRLLHPIRKLPEHSMFLSNSSRADDWLVVRWSCVRSLGLLVCFILSLALINRAGGLYGRILTEVVSTDRTQWGLYTRPRSRFSHTDRLSSVNEMFIIWQKQEQFNSFNVTGFR